MEILAIENLTKTYGEKTLFNQLSFSIQNRDRIGIVGVNGTGKSTLLKVIAGIEDRDHGALNHARDFKIAYLSQEPNLNHDRTVLAEIFAGESEVMTILREYEQALFNLGKNPTDPDAQVAFTKMQTKMDQQDAWDAATTAKTILTKLGIDQFDQKINTLSGGQQKRVALAKALVQPAHLLILDEPTNHLDHESIEWLEKFLPTYQGAVMLVTHDRYFLNRVTTKIYELDLGQLYQYTGNYETYLTKKAERLELAKQDEQKHANVLRSEMAWLKRGARARSTKQKARIERIGEMQTKTFATDQSELEFGVGSTRLGKKVLELHNISKSYDANKLITDFSFLIKPGDRIGIVGANGTGKSTLLNLIAERITPDQGEIETGPTVKFGYYQQDHSDMDENLKIIEYIRETAEVIHTEKNETITAEQMLERFLFPRSQQWTYIRRLSGGEKRRLYLLKVLMEEPNVLLLDEPTNDLDTHTLAILEDYLDSFPGVVITVSHDRYFLDRVVEQLLVFKESGTIEPFYGNYSEFLAKQTEPKSEPAEEKSKPVPSRPKKRRLSYQEQKEWATIEDEIEALEEAIEVEKEAVIEAGADADAVHKHYDRQLELEDELEVKMERWEELSLIVEAIEQE
ncbi:ABC-F family ATP-binding cassette domain-containing protein [Amphibacillus indicireducens]|uniref:ABC-F family ATP-binding cassette domain-containing protein n=1 Tax=Amphibacillus indicireducens TaxID=1076330 RepID=A0ABP7W0Y7_9BACI